MEDPTVCSVCLSNFRRAVILQCGHTFCKRCCAKVKTCPLCRAHITARTPNRALREIVVHDSEELSDEEPSHEESVSVVDFHDEPVILIEPETTVNEAPQELFSSNLLAMVSVVAFLLLGTVLVFAAYSIVDAVLQLTP